MYQFCNVLFHCFDHKIVLKGMKEEISQQRCIVGAQNERRCMLSIRKSIARPSSRQEKYVYFVDVLWFAQKVRKLLVAMKLFPLVLKTLSKRSWSCFLSWACGRLVWSVEKSQVLTWFSESCFSSSTRITSIELLMIHMQLTPVLTRIVLAVSGAVGADQFKTLSN